MPRQPTVSRTGNATQVTALILDTLTGMTDDFTCLLPEHAKDPAHILPKVQSILDCRVGISKFKAVQVKQINHIKVCASMPAILFLNQASIKIL